MTSEQHQIPNPLAVFLAAVMFRSKEASPADGPTITISRGVFDDLVSVAHLASKATVQHLQGEVANISLNDGQFIAKFEHPLTGTQTGVGKTLLQALANGSFQMECAVNRLLQQAHCARDF